MRFDEDRSGRPFYARMLRLRQLRPGGFLCFLFFEGMIAFSVLLTLAELVNWVAVLILPTSVAVMVKVNDVVLGLVPGQPRRPGLHTPASASAAGPVRGSAPVRRHVWPTAQAPALRPPRVTARSAVAVAVAPPAASDARRPAPMFGAVVRDPRPRGYLRRSDRPNQRRFERPA
jgi:hypothetical protein